MLLFSHPSQGRTSDLGLLPSIGFECRRVRIQSDFPKSGDIPVREFDKRETPAMAKVLAAIFFGHRNPMNADTSNAYTQAWRHIGQRIPRPNAILSISAHWFVPQTGVTISTAPRTIHDFGGFPPELYQVKYPAPGNPELADRVQKLLAPLDAVSDNAWGLDHGTWSVLGHV
jgi:4,5-DOPA dioxygenase extradiol